MRFTYDDNESEMQGGVGFFHVLNTSTRGCYLDGHPQVRAPSERPERWKANARRGSWALSWALSPETSEREDAVPRLTPLRRRRVRLRPPGHSGGQR